ncbi:unnamed protein product [Cylicocyclus nassatus]|uniref:VWFA domain-containing protein n=1 Tax=Cylicocyclus nassatus TaxID=53992 RepID=A0AA36GLJ6_CYLNA|nr:unnamed protein product [Cylicocyclus nassatus]
MSDDEFEEFEEKDVKPVKKKRLTKKDKYGALVLVIDCGSSMQETSDGRSYFSMAKEAADWILSRKIFTHAREHITIILFGCKETKNPLDMKGVFLQNEVLSPLSFDHLRFLEHEVVSNPKAAGNAVDALIVATDFLHQQTDGDPAVESKNILIFTNGIASLDGRKSEVSALVNGITAMGATLISVGIDEESVKARSSGAQILDLVKKTEGSNYSFRDAATALHHFTTPHVDSRAIRKNWEIAPGIRLPLAMYTKSVPAKNPLRSVLVDEHGAEMHRQSRFMANIKTADSSGDFATEVKELTAKEQRLQVHYFGDTKVPIGEDDEERYHNHNFNEGEPRGCMKLIQFTKKENLKDCYFIGRNSFVVVPGWEKKTSERDLEAMRTTLSLISAMLENNVVAICRYAPDAAKHLQLIALIPHKDEELDLPYLQALRLPFAEDMRPFNFINLDATCPKPTHNQLNLVDELIDAMPFGTEKGSLEPENIPNPFFQRQCTAMKLKALNAYNSGDDKKISELIAPSSFLKRGLEPDPKILEKAQHVLDAMQNDENGFNLQEVVKMKRPKQEIRQEDISEWLAELEATQKDEVEVKTKKDVKKPAHGKYIDRARSQLEDNFEYHMESLLEEVSVMTAAEDEEAEQLYPIAHARLISLRTLAVEFDRPTEFNEWLMNSKTQFPEWAQYCATKSSLFLISNTECSASEYSEDEARAIWNESE